MQIPTRVDIQMFQQKYKKFFGERENCFAQMVDALTFQKKWTQVIIPGTSLEDHKVEEKMTHSYSSLGLLSPPEQTNYAIAINLYV